MGCSMKGRKQGEREPHRSLIRPLIVGKDSAGRQYVAYIYETCWKCGECFLWKLASNDVCPACKARVIPF